MKVAFLVFLSVAALAWWAADIVEQAFALERARIDITLAIRTQNCKRFSAAFRILEEKGQLRASEIPNYRAVERRLCVPLSHLGGST